MPSHQEVKDPYLHLLVGFGAAGSTGSPHTVAIASSTEGP